MLTAAVLLILSHVLGSVPFNILVTKVWRSIDITVIPLEKRPDEETGPGYGSELFFRPFL
jgi:hypothetical protein